MSNYLTEEEQLQQLKDWWKKYGNKLLTVILIVTLAFFAWRWVQERELAQLAHASEAYETLLEEVANKDTVGVELQADYLFKHYPKTTYAQLGALFLARQQVYSGEYEAAEEQLAWVIEQASNESLSQIARLRLARILEMRTLYDEALAILAVIDDDIYTSAIFEIRGDIYLSQGEREQARTAYVEAMSKMAGATVANPLLEMKLNSLPESSAQMTDESTLDEFPNYA